VSIRLERDGQRLERRLTPIVPPSQSRFEVGDIGVLPNVNPNLQSVNPGEPGERAGLRAGDVIVAVDGKPMTFLTQLREAIASRPEQPMTVSILRDGVRQDLVVTPGRRDGSGWLGVVIADQTRRFQPTALEAIGLSVQRNIESSALIFKTVWGLLTRETSPKQLMGPVAIAQLSGESAQLGWIPLLSLMAAISLNLGLLNLLPSPSSTGVTS
jgi:regulator of sigma E protease